MKAKLVSFIISLFIFLSFAALAHASQAGKITNIDGRVDITSPGKPAKPLLIGDTVNEGDIIRTKTAAKCEITWIDGSIARLAENSRFQVMNYSLSKENRRAILNLFRGKVQSIVKSATQVFGKPGDSKYEVHTPTSVCGVRGTNFFSYFQNGVSGALFTEGTGYGYSKGRPDNVQTIAPGQMMIVTHFHKPATVRESLKGEVNKFLNDTTPSEKRKNKGDDRGKTETGSGHSSNSGGNTASASGNTTSSSGSSNSSSSSDSQSTGNATTKSASTNSTTTETSSATNLNSSANTTSSSESTSASTITSTSTNSSTSSSTSTSTSGTTLSDNSATASTIASVSTSSSTGGTILSDNVATVSTIASTSTSTSTGGTILSDTTATTVNTVSTSTTSGNTILGSTTTLNVVIPSDASTASTSTNTSISSNSASTSSSSYNASSASASGSSSSSSSSSSSALYSSNLNGTIYQTVAGTLYTNTYENISMNPSVGSTFPIKYETAYVDSGSGNVKYGWQMEDFSIAGSYGQVARQTYYPDGWTHQNVFFSFTRTSQLASSLGFDPDLSASPPKGFFNQGRDIISDVYPFTSSPLSLSQIQEYAKVFSQAVPNFYYMISLTPGQPDTAFNGSASMFRKAGDPDTLFLWNATAQPLSLVLSGQNIAFTGNATMSAGIKSDTADAGAYIGLLNNHVASDLSIAGMFYGLYISPAGDAGFLKSTNITGALNSTLWTATGDIYSISKLAGSSIPATQLLQLDPSGKYVNLQLGLMTSDVTYGGAGGDFISGGSMTQMGTGQGPILSIKGYSDWGIFAREDSGGKYNNPNGSTTWRADFVGYETLGSLNGNPPDYGIWHMWVANSSQSTWANNKITAPIAGEFLTLAKQGTISGSYIGNYSGTNSGIWGGTTSGIYEKTRDVAFGSSISGSVYSNKLVSWIQGVTNDSHYQYFINGNPDPTFSNQENTYVNKMSNSFTGAIAETRYDSQGYKDAANPVSYTKTIWNYDRTYDNVNHNYSISNLQLIESIPISSTDYLSEINAMRGASETTGWKLSNSADLQGIFAGFNASNGDNLWTNIAGRTSTEIALASLYDVFDYKTPSVMKAGMASFNPANSGSASPTIGGAYFSFLGAAFGTKTSAYDVLDGTLTGLYLAPDGSAGILYGTYTGNNLPAVGYWNASGGIKGYELTPTNADPTVTPDNFVAKLYRSSSEYRWNGPNFLRSDTDLGSSSSSLAYVISESASSRVFPDSLGIFSFVSAGTYTGAVPNKWNYVFDIHANQDGTGDLISTSYISTDWDTTTNPVASNIRSGSVLHNGTFDPATATGRLAVIVSHTGGITSIQGSDIKGLFDPTTYTWQAVANGTSIETAAFVNLVNRFTTDAEKNAFMAAMKIPCINVGQVNFDGSGSLNGNSLQLSMRDVNFYAYSTGQTPRLFATNNVSGNYTYNGGTMPTINLSATTATNFSGAPSPISATFTPQIWDTVGNKWSGEVMGTGKIIPGSTGNVTYTGSAANIVFKGGAAGSLTPAGASTGTLSGTAAGVVR